MAELSARQARAVVALLTASSLTVAAKQAGVGERTLRRWLKDATFRTAYRETSQRFLQEATGRLRAAAGEAVDTLRHALRDERPANRIRAATVLLDVAVKVEVNELAERVAALEEAQNGRDEHTRQN